LEEKVLNIVKHSYLLGVNVLISEISVRRNVCQKKPQPQASIHMALTAPNFNLMIQKNNKKLVLRHKMQMQTQQRTPLSNRETRDETNVSSAYS